MTFSIRPGANDGRPLEVRPHYLCKDGYCVEMYPTKELAMRALLENDQEARAEAMRKMEEDTPE